MRIRQMFLRNPRKGVRAAVDMMTGEANKERLRAYGVVVSNSCVINQGCYFDLEHGFAITIGEHVVLAPQVMIMAHDAASRNFDGSTRIAPVVIKDYAYIGARAILLPGSTVGVGAAVGAGALVSGEVPDGALCVGVPGRVVGTVSALREGRKERQTGLNTVAGFVRTMASSDSANARLGFRELLADQGEMWV